MAALCLTSAPTAQAAPPNIPISSLPFTISAPGTYILTGNLTSAPSNNGTGGINILTPITGLVTVDLKGFTITGPGIVSGSYGIIIGNPNGPVSNTSPVTIRNGAITSFLTGILDFRTSDITINNVVFNQNLYAVELNTVQTRPLTIASLMGLAPRWYNKTRAP